MGVTGLWQVLSEVGQLKDLSEGGETLAVDLSAWIHQASCASFHQKSSSSYFITRTIFFRTLDLLKCGMKLIFVVDGTAPDLKLKTLEKRRGSPGKSEGPAQSFDRSRLKHHDQEVVNLLKSLGVPVVESPGEAEKMCAYLNSAEIVDAVITDDGDALLYGAKKVYRNCDFNKKTATSISLQDIETQLDLTRSSLIGFALLSGCDYSPGGVKGVGPDQIKEMYKEMQKHGSDTDVLERICGWKEDGHLQHLDKVKVELEGMKRSAHCSNCDHTGNRLSHDREGCDVCETEKKCKTDPVKLCECPLHQLKHQFEPYRREIGARDKALQDPSFPERCRQIQEEFLDTTKENAKITAESLTSKCPNLTEIVSLVSRTIKLNKTDVVSKLVPVFINMQLRKEFTWDGLCPLRIEKSCKRSHVACYETTWSKMKEDAWTSGQTYSVDVEQKLFAETHGNIVSKFLDISAKKSTSSTPCRQKLIQEMFSSPENVKKSNRSAPVTPRKGDNSNDIMNPGWKKKLNFGPSSSKSENKDSEDEVDVNNSSTSYSRQFLGNSSKYSEDLGELSSLSQVVSSSNETDVHSYHSEDLFGSGEDSERDSTSDNSLVASLVNVSTKDEDSDCEIVEEETSGNHSNKPNAKRFDTAEDYYTEREPRTALHEKDILKCDVPADNFTDSDDVLDIDSSSRTGFGNGSHSGLRSLGLADSESGSSSEVHTVELVESGSSSPSTNGDTPKDLHSEGPSEGGAGNGTQAELHSLGLGDSQSCSSSRVRASESADPNSSSNDVMMICSSLPRRRSSSSSDVIIVDFEKKEKPKEQVPCKRKYEKKTGKPSKKSKRTPEGNQKTLNYFFSNKK